MKKNRKNRITHSGEFLRKQRANQEAFLTLFRKYGLQNRACEESGVDHNTVYAWRKDPKFEQRFLEAETGISRLAHDEAIRRAVYGYDKAVFYEGEQVATVKEYSDALLAKILSAHDRRFRNTTDDGQPLPAGDIHLHVNVVKPTDANSSK